MGRRYSPEYKAYLASPAWRKLCAEALRRAGYKCQQCGKNRKQARCSLDTHHALGYGNFTRERVEELLVLCRYPCHERAHGRPGYGAWAWRWWARALRGLFTKGRR